MVEGARQGQMQAPARARALLGVIGVIWVAGTSLDDWRLAILDPRFAPGLGVPDLEGIGRATAAAPAPTPCACPPPSRAGHQQRQAPTP
jgi:hypothetical protein